MATTDGEAGERSERPSWARAEARGGLQLRAVEQRTGATEDHRAAVAAFVAKETPVFNGR